MVPIAKNFGPHLLANMSKEKAVFVVNIYELVCRVGFRKGIRLEICFSLFP